MKARVSCALLSASLVFSHASALATANFGKVIVDGEEIPSFYFDIATDKGDVGPDEPLAAPFDALGVGVLDCEEETNKYALEEIIALWIIRNAGQLAYPKEAARLNKFNVFSETYERDEEIPAKGTQKYRDTKFNVLNFHGGMLEDQYFKHYKESEVVERYNEMIESDHPFVVNVPVYKLNPLIFRTREEAEKATSRLVAGESFTALATEYKQAKYFAVRDAFKWRRSSDMLEAHRFMDNPPPRWNKGEIVGPVVMFGGMHENSMGYLGWKVIQVADKRVMPVVSFKGDGPDFYLDTKFVIRYAMEQAQKVNIRKRLWAAATVSVDGVVIPEYTGNAELSACSG